ncbi:hypothetical protein Egran_03470 [Elaphomyces granulatus]|uniref:Tryptophan synthase beta chain-like PALP domain-containing protein n=1 Tax=Elaphomyces granulatus TaxID=519963 RepID=A0A232LXG3_9EURO|nr:hypothetical protein Egran_03470 [Elaphomyces granulatus]
MTDPSHWLPLTEESILSAHSLIQPYIQRTPLLTSESLNRIASAPQKEEALVGTEFEGQQPANPKMSFFLKCENFQRTRAFKVRGAFHAMLRLIQTKGIDEVRRSGVITHSAGNHALALALAARTFDIPSYIVMPSISTPFKIEATKSYGATVIFSGPTSQEREAVAKRVIDETGAIFVSSANHPDIILGQGTVGLELEQQVRELVSANPGSSLHVTTGEKDPDSIKQGSSRTGNLDAVITPIGCGGLNSGVATLFASRPQTFIFGAEPSFEGGDDCRRGLAAGHRIMVVRTLTIAEGLRQPVGEIPWTIISDDHKVRGVYAVSEEQIKSGMKLVLEQVGMLVEPSAVVGLAVALYNEEFRRMVEREAPDGWDIGIVFSGGNTTPEAILKLYEDEGGSVGRENGLN